MRYVSRLMYSAGAKRDNLSRDVVLRKLEEQNYRCALTGVPMTCKLEKGINCYTNASIDRIIPGAAYSEDNIQLVCKIVNIVKWNMSIDELKEWCRRILNGPQTT